MNIHTAPPFAPPCRTAASGPLQDVVLKSDGASLTDADIDAIISQV